MCIVYLWFATLAGRWCLDIQGAHSQSLKRGDCELEVRGNVALHATKNCGKGYTFFSSNLDQSTRVDYITSLLLLYWLDYLHNSEFIIVS